MDITSTFSKIFKSVILFTTLICTQRNLQAEDIVQKHKNLASTNESLIVDPAKLYCSRIEQTEDELKSIYPNIESEDCRGTTAETLCFNSAVEKYLKKIDEYHSVISGPLSRDSKAELFPDKSTHDLFIKSHNTWQELKNAEFALIEEFYSGEGTMYPRTIAHKKALFLKYSAERLLGYIVWRCANS